MRAKGHRERSVTMSDPLEETISLSDMTEITETEDPRATQHGSTLGTDPSGQANQLEGGKSEPGYSCRDRALGQNLELAF